ncbi:FHA domain-containing protein FhaB/FipA [Ornithinicoccus hortensis]|uniref:Type III secretion system (T3SS) inner membrane Yop/YscD-like protein n=1 Tax=Ornithinicoccus hortensis TaxID=82346 RepID=A0A542YMZ2_9MICO|nr:FHA domain-containing protein [Ornithinicoccus hortensis]TQL49466.1 type III secretion system (T3SS) inner membrane Yop/YscD-like protein [Ornithinicoccus hortensis]
MSELTLNIVRLGLLVLLWAFVFSVVGALRGDLYGTRVTSRGAAAPRGPGRTARPARSARKGPSHVAVVAGSLRGTTVPLTDNGLLIGRNPECSLVLTDDFASGRHLRLYPGEAGSWYAEDLGSTNGTFLNNQRITTPTVIEPGSQIRIGQTILELKR